MNSRHIVVFLMLALVASGCSMKKNTRSTRNFKAMNTRFNVFFNGKTSYDEGIKSIATAHTEDYSAIIPLYPISRHENANAAKGSMDRAIEKSRKAIKLYSIKQKPARNIRKWSDPEYRLWYNQEEFNPALVEAWLMLAKAEFHKADFIGSVGTFTYITRHYSHDKDMVARCQLWITRAYAEMGWIYEAEQVLSKLKQDDLKTSHLGLFAIVNADLLLKKQQYREAIPFLEIALKSEKEKLQKQRMHYLLAQLYLKTDNKKDAFKAFSEVIKMNPPYEMDFNARIYRAEINPNVNSVRKELDKMLRNPNNKDFHDQIYFALGKTYMQQRDTVQAMKLFAESAEKSTRNGFDKALTLITLGDLYYNKQNYIKAQPCYDEASKIITVENEDYKRVAKRAETLSELVVQYEIVVLQDSLQHLASLPEDKRLEVVNKLIEKLIADEKAATEAEARKATQGMDEPELMRPIGFNQGAGDWYFYNPAIIKTGQNEFRKKWGTRKLEDNWRRTNKSTALFAEESATNNEDSLPNDSTATASSANVSDQKSPEFYLQQIPVTASAIKKSNGEIADALFSMGMIYKDKVEDYPMAIKTFDEFARRFPTDKRVLEAYYQSYIICVRQENESLAQIYKTKLTTEFPESKYVEVISQPNYSARMERMYLEQDSLYRVTYAAYNRSDFKAVRAGTAYIKQQYPLSTLLPKFLFLEALSVGKTENQEKFEVILNDLVEKYPESDVSAMSKDIIALMKQGRESKTGTTHGSLLARRDEAVKSETVEIKDRELSPDKTLKHRLLLITKADKEGLNAILFNLAAYNFTRFIVKDFDLVVSPLDSVTNSISITNLDSYDEALWYWSSVSTDASIKSLIEKYAVEKIIISEENFGMLRTIYSVDEYLAFHNKVLATGQKSTIITPALLAQVKKPTVTETIKTKTENAINTSSATAQPTVEKPMVREHPKITDKKVDVETVEKQKEIIAEKVTQPTKEVIITQPTKVEEVVPLFKNLFAYREKEEHFVAIAVLSGNLNFEKLKSGFDTYHKQNYAMLQLKVANETIEKTQMIIIGPFADANIAKSYLLRMVKENALLEPLKDTDYRNLVGSQKNLNVMMQQNAMSTYFEFMQQYYLK